MLKTKHKQVVLSVLLVLVLVLGVCGCADRSSDVSSESDSSHLVTDRTDEIGGASTDTNANASNSSVTTTTTTDESDETAQSPNSTTAKKLTTTKHETTTTTKKEETTKKPTTGTSTTSTTKEVTTTTKDPYQTIQLYVKTTYHGYIGYFTKDNSLSSFDPTILGLDENYSYISGYITEYYDIADDENIYFAVDTNVVKYPIFSSIIDNGEGRFMVPVRTRN